MTFTYTNSPKTSTVDALRLLLGDVDAANSVFSNEELEYFSSMDTNKFMVAYHACQSAAAKFSQLSDKSLGPMNVSYSQVAESFRKQAEVFYATANRKAIPVATMTTTSARFTTGFYRDSSI